MSKTYLQIEMMDRQPPENIQLMEHQQQVLQQIEMLNNTNTEITRKNMETMTTPDRKLEETFYTLNDETGEFDITTAGIRYQAECFWRDNEFYDICCDNEDEDDHLCKFEAIGKIEDQTCGTGTNLVVHNECKNRKGPAHSYYVTLLQEDDGGNRFYITAWNPIECPQTPRLYEGELINNPNISSLTTTEIKFWGEVAKIYPTIPAWMIEHDLTDWDDAPWGFDDPDYEIISSLDLPDAPDIDLDTTLADLIQPLIYTIFPNDPAWGRSWFPSFPNPCNEIPLSDSSIPRIETKDQTEEQESYYSPFDGETK